jgi:serine/threonine protein kinase
LDLNQLCMGCMTDKKEDHPECPNCGFIEGTMPDSPLFLPPRTVLQEKYLIGRVLGQGGFGITYLAWDLNLNVKLAIKEYFPQDLASRAAGHSQVSAYSGSMGSQYDYGLDKFLQEARTLAQFEGHPNIVSVRDFFKANGTAYFVMSYVEGVTLKDHLANSGGTLSVDQSRAVLMPVMDALKEVHAVNVLHRDISPDNIFINKKGQVILIDFGAARQAIGEKGRSLSIILKPGYAPEEQYRTKGVQGPWTDIYAIAATFYHLITGHQPPEALERLVEDPLEPPSKFGALLSEVEESALLKGLAVRAPDRFQTMGEFQAAFLGDIPVKSVTPPVQVVTPSAEKVVSKPKKAIPSSLLIGGAAAVILLAVAVALWFGGFFDGSTEAVTSEPDPALIIIEDNDSGGDDATEDTLANLVVNSKGNSSGNIINGGLAATQGEWIYFRSNEAGSLKAGKFDGSGAKIISADSAWFINVAGEWIYYSNRDDQNRIYKINVDGSGRTALSEGGSWFVTLVDGWLYYLDESDKYRIYKVNTEGEGRTRLSEDSAWFINVEDNWVYYVNRSDADKVYRVRSDAGDKEPVTESASCCISMDNGWVYYINEADDSRLYKMKPDGSEVESINDHPSWFVNASGGWIYYADEDDNFSLNKIRPDGTERIKLASEPVRFINVIGDWIFYLDQSETDTVYKVRQDGTGRSPVESGF